ncbi:MAG TPA: acylase, partial [Gemmatimonadales bacterium]|nr:acylase [Gemmatimonadales bacterium]
LLALAACAPSNPELARWERQAADVTITRDDWGIAHVKGKTDADAVFGMIYAQAEDDFNRVETNYLNALGRLAEAEGEKDVYRDLRMKLFINPDSLQAMYGRSPEWLQRLMTAWADGLNYFLHTHPEMKPRVITRFEPWMALSFTEGSIGGDIEQVSLRGLEAFYGSQAASAAPSGGYDLAEHDVLLEPSGSNGIAIAPSNSVSGHALLLINPHTSFFFRSELQMTSDEGLNAYGAVTWGQFFIYQGFNEKAGWMHTSSGADNIDYYFETVTQGEGGPTYRYGTEERPVTASTITVPFRTDSGMASRQFTVYRTHHGPVVREQDGKCVTVRLMEEPIKALMQSYGRTKSTGLANFRETMELHTNSSNNTVYADAEGNIGYFHANFIPKRDPRFDWTKPVDGSDPATEWQGVLSIDESPNVFNPANGWIQNTNNWPFSAAGANSPRREDYPAYVDTDGENPRGIHAIRVLEGKKDFTLTSLIEAAYDSQLPAFDDLIPALVSAWEKAPAGHPLKARLAEPVALLRDWDRRWGKESVATAVAVFWGDELWRRVSADEDLEGMSVYQYMAAKTSGDLRLQALMAAVDRLEQDFGSWRTPWGEINRFQRLTGDIVQPFADTGASIPVGFTSSRWGSLASFGTRRGANTKRIYGVSGNSFVAVVEFGDSVRARAVSAGGESGDPASPHFNDQAQRYADGALREVYFYPGQLEGHTERVYRPGK